MYQAQEGYKISRKGYYISISISLVITMVFLINHLYIPAIILVVFAILEVTMMLILNKAQRS